MNAPTMTPERFERTLAARGIVLTESQRFQVFEAPIRRLLTTGNPKTAKGEGYGYLTAILHLAPYLQSGLQVCPLASKGCRTVCLNTAGRGAFDQTIPAARNRRTWQYFARRDEFMAQLAHEIAAHIRTAARHGLKPCVRLNGTSDIRWENVPCGEHESVFAAFPDLQLYDYTKILARTETGLPPNYHLTFSASESNADDVDRAIAQGTNVAVVFRSLAILERANGRKGSKRHQRSAAILMKRMALPETWQGRPVIDADKHDLRFLDGQGVIAALRAKGSAVTDDSGFVRNLP